MKKKIGKSLAHHSIKANMSQVLTEFIRARREKLGLTLDEAAKLAGMSTSIQWQKIESGTTGNPRVETVYKMAAALKVKPGQLLRKQ